MQYLNKSHSSCIWSLFVGELVSYLRYLCLFAYSGVQHILCCVFLRLVYTMLPVSLCFSSSCVHYVASFSVFFFVLCTLCCQFLWIVLFFIAPSALCYVYLNWGFFLTREKYDLIIEIYQQISNNSRNFFRHRTVFGSL